MSESDAPGRHARALLERLSRPDGIHASLAATDNYRAVFTRDAVMAGIAGGLLESGPVCAGLVGTLRRLRDLQGPQGQVASNYTLQLGGAPLVSFGTLAPRIDGTTWYLVGVAVALRAGLVTADEFRASVERAVSLLDALEYNGRHLVYVPTGGNWADEYIYEGYILYDQLLRAWALRLLAPLYDVPAWEAKAERIVARIEEAFFRESTGPQHPTAAFTPARRFEMFDLAAAALLGVSGLLPARARDALHWIDATFLARGTLPPAFHPVIAPGDADWPALRRYHLHAFRNAPHEYHNGGIWPIWLGWLAVAAARCGHQDTLTRLRTLAAAALGAHPPLEFREYLHGETGAPLGTPDMAYTATGVILLDAAEHPRLAHLLPA